MRAKVNIKSNFSKSITERVFDEAIFIIRTSETLKVTAKRYGVSISTAWRDMRDRLPLLNPGYYRRVDDVINSHKKGVR